jgi:hypothetical protein
MLRPTKVSPADRPGPSPMLPAAAVMLIVLFAVSLAVAAPLDEDSDIQWVRGDATAIVPNIGTKPLDSAETDDSSSTEAEAGIFTMPLPAPHYHDRYRFYHRYDFDLRSRLTPVMPQTD